MALNYTTPEEAVMQVESGNRVFIHGSAATPIMLINALLARAGSINNVELTSISTYGNIDWNHPEVLKSFYLNSLFVSGNVRGWANSEYGGYVPVFLSEIPQLFDKKILPLDVAIIQVSPPDSHGYCSLGTSVDAALSAVRNARKVIAHVNPKMPRVLGDGIIPISSFSSAIWHETGLVEVNYAAQTDEVTDRIGANIAITILYVGRNRLCSCFCRCCQYAIGINRDGH